MYSWESDQFRISSLKKCTCAHTHNILYIIPAGVMEPLKSLYGYQSLLRTAVLVLFVYVTFYYGDFQIHTRVDKNRQKSIMNLHVHIIQAQNCPSQASSVLLPASSVIKPITEPHIWDISLALGLLPPNYP